MVSFGFGNHVSSTVPSVVTVASPTPVAPVVSGLGVAALTAATVTRAQPDRVPTSGSADSSARSDSTALAMSLSAVAHASASEVVHSFAR